MLYSESGDFSNKYREEQIQELEKLICIKRKDADLRRAAYFKPDFSSISAYEQSVEKYRADFINMLGWPLNTYSKDLPVPEAQITYVADDSLGRIYRLNIEVIPDVTCYGILFLPHTPPPYPLVISQHGGCGTPELCSGFLDENASNYNNMTRRVLRKGFAVFAPQVFVWGDVDGSRREQADSQFKQLGGSVAAFDMFKLMRSIDYLQSREDIYSGRLGMIGLSYGGFYTMYTAAADPRIKACLSSCFFSNRFVYDRKDWTWFNSGNIFLDAEVCGLICPRSLYIEVGNKDQIFDVAYAGAEYGKVRAFYEKFGLPDRFIYKEFDGYHELDPDDAGINFLCDKINNDI